MREVSARVRRADVLVAAWLVLWIIIAFVVFREVRSLASLSDSVTRAGRAVETSGDALSGLSSLPLVGDRVRTPAREAQDAGRQAQSSGRRSRRSIRRLSVLLAVVVAVLPTVPFILLYVPALGPGARRRRREGESTG